MILFLSSSFLSRLRIQWKPDLKGFLVGNRNLFFFYPEMILEAEINPGSIDHFLATHGQEAWQLLGFLSPAELPFFPGYAELNTNGARDPKEWTARVHLPGDQGPDYRSLEIKRSQSPKQGDS